MFFLKFKNRFFYEMDFFGSFHGLKLHQNGHFNTSDGLFWVISSFF